MTVTLGASLGYKPRDFPETPGILLKKKESILDMSKVFFK